MKAYLINMHLLVPRSRSSAKVKVKYKSYISQKMAISEAFVFRKHNLFPFPTMFFILLKHILFGLEHVKSDIWTFALNLCSLWRLIRNNTVWFMLFSGFDQVYFSTNSNFFGKCHLKLTLFLICQF